jgi:assimilatory nitrate reductase catalytic subunit
MARLPVSVTDLVDRFGPHRHDVPPGGWVSSGEPDRVVKTHCCFCGQQCGIQLKVKDEKVVGFEPWEDFPFNRGKLCPKGVKRYMQNDHPDRLLSPLVRAEGRGFEEATWDDALGQTVAAMKQIQGDHGRDAYAVLTGASLTNEKAYLMGKLARVALRTANIDYNGRLCMVSAAAASKKILGIDRSANPWSDIPEADVILVAGANVAECAPITTDYIWRARERGAKLIVLDPRMTPIARHADLFIPVRSGGDIGIFNGMLHVMIERGWVDRAFIDEHTTGFDAVAASVAKYTPEYAAKIAGVPASMIVRAAELWGPARTSFLLHARGIEHHSKGVENCMAAINLVVATGRIGKRGCGYAMITGQGNGQGGREQGQKCDQLPGARDIENPEHRRHMAEVWGVPEPSIPHKGVSAVELVEKIHAGEIKGLLLICFNPLVSLPDQDFVREALEKLEHFTVIDFFLSETARHADVVLPGSLIEEDEGTITTVEGRVVLHQKVVEPPAGARADWRIICDLAAGLGVGDKFAYESPREIFEELRRASRGESPITTVSPGSASSPRRASSGRVPRWITRGHRASTRAPASATPMARPTSSRSSGALPSRSRTRSIPSCSPRVAWSLSICRDRRPGGSARSTTRIHSPSARSTPGSPTSSASPSPTSSRSRAAEARSSSAPWWSRPSGRTPCSCRTTGR